ncbi:MAG TPA: MOSC N-terminal beta barrel domain-containing protein [Tepidisphaeraceae bacterium]
MTRYPVKSMAGESLSEAAVGPMGISGDREVYVRDARGDIVTARTRPKLLLHHATIDACGEPIVDGLPWQHPDVATLVADAADEGARLVRARSGERFDVLPLLVATDGMVSALGVDRRRLRPNLLIGGVKEFSEREWQGRFLRIGSVVIALANLRDRCLMTTWDPDTAQQDKKVLTRIYREFGGAISLNAWAVSDGLAAVGDEVELLDNEVVTPPPILGRFVKDVEGAG